MSGTPFNPFQIRCPRCGAPHTFKELEHRHWSCTCQPVVPAGLRTIAWGHIFKVMENASKGVYPVESRGSILEEGRGWDNELYKEQEARNATPPRPEGHASGSRPPHEGKGTTPPGDILQGSFVSNNKLVGYPPDRDADGIKWNPGGSMAGTKPPRQFEHHKLEPVEAGGGIWNAPWLRKDEQKKAARGMANYPVDPPEAKKSDRKGKQVDRTSSQQHKQQGEWSNSNRQYPPLSRASSRSSGRTSSDDERTLQDVMRATRSRPPNTGGGEGSNSRQADRSSSQQHHQQGESSNRGRQVPPLSRASSGSSGRSSSSDEQTLQAAMRAIRPRPVDNSGGEGSRAHQVDETAGVEASMSDLKIARSTSRQIEPQKSSRTHGKHGKHKKAEDPEESKEPEKSKKAKESKQDRANKGPKHHKTPKERKDSNTSEHKGKGKGKDTA